MRERNEGEAKPANEQTNGIARRQDKLAAVYV